MLHFVCFLACFRVEHFGILKKIWGGGAQIDDFYEDFLPFSLG